MDTYQLDSMDEQILSMLIHNARIPFLEIARACGVSGTTIHQRVQRLTSLGVIQGTEYKVDPAKIGYETCAFVGLCLVGDTTLKDAVEALGKISEVVEVHCTSEEFDLLVKLYAHNNNHLLYLVEKKLRPIGLSKARVIVSFDVMLQKQLCPF